MGFRNPASQTYANSSKNPCINTQNRIELPPKTRQIPETKHNNQHQTESFHSGGWESRRCCWWQARTSPSAILPHKLTQPHTNPPKFVTLLTPNRIKLPKTKQTQMNDIRRWLGISTPLVVAGAYFAFRKQPIAGNLPIYSLSSNPSIYSFGDYQSAHLFSWY